jgi:hypothetical protein
MRRRELLTRFAALAFLGAAWRRIASATVTYFGVTTVDASVNVAGSTYWNDEISWVCPGTGSQDVKALGLWANVWNASYPQNIRLALYDLAGNLIAQGSTAISVTSATPSYWEHSSFVDVAGNPIFPTLVGGTGYKIVSTGSGTYVDDLQHGILYGATESIAYKHVDYTAGFPAALPTPDGSGTFRPAQSCGVEPTPANTRVGRRVIG